MSPGPERGKKRGGLVRRTRAGQAKPRGEGLTTIPRAAWPTLKAVLGEHGWLGLIPACCICHLSGVEITESRLDGNELVVFSGRLTRRFALPADDLALLDTLLAKLASATATMTASRRANYVAEFLHTKIEPEVRRRLEAEGKPWARHVKITVTTLQRLGVEALVAGWRDRREFVRAYLRSSRAHPEDALPDATEEVMAGYDEAVASFWASVAGQLSPRAREAIARLANES